MIIGCCGAGKSTLAKELQQRTSLPLIHLDQAYWQPNWTEPDKEEWMAKVEKLASWPRWIIDGNYSSSMEIRLAKADTIIFLDRSTLTCLGRVLRRIFKYYGRVRPDMPAGCKERLNWDFLHYVLIFNRTRRPKIMRMIRERPDGKTLIRLRSNRDVRHFMASV